MLRRTHLSLMAAATALLIGCESESPQPTTSGEPVSTTQPQQAATAVEATDEAARETADEGERKPSEDEPIVEIVKWDEVMKTVSSSGKPVVLDVWSLVCEPCLKEFPGLVRLHSALGDQVACYSANVDFDGRKTRPPETYRPHVEAFLQQVDAEAFSHFISATSSDKVYTELDIVSIPTVVVFHADGTIAKKFVDAGETAGFTYDEDIIPFVKSLITRQ